LTSEYEVHSLGYYVTLQEVGTHRICCHILTSFYGSIHQSVSNAAAVFLALVIPHGGAS